VARFCENQNVPYQCLQPLLTFISLALLFCIETCARASGDESNVLPANLLTNCAAVHDLPRDVAERRLPLRVRGIVTLAFPGDYNNFVMQDDSAGIFVGTGQTTAVGLPAADLHGFKRLEVGMLVEVSGISGPGAFAPVIVPQSILPVGTSPLPAPCAATHAALNHGTLDCERAEMGGVVWRAEVEPYPQTGLHLDLAGPEGFFDASVENPNGLKAANLVDATLRLKGVCFSTSNLRGEFVSASLMVNDAGDVTIEQSASPNPFAAPEVPLHSLRQFSPLPPDFHRRRVTGTVTLYRPGHFFYLQAGNQAVRVNSSQATPLALGDRVEASGFVKNGDYFAELTEAAYRLAGAAKLPEPAVVTRDLVLNPRFPKGNLFRTEDYDGQIVSLRGRLEKIEMNINEERRLFLDFDGHILEASLGTNVPAAALDDFRPGSELQLTGVCVEEFPPPWPNQGTPAPIGLHLLLRTVNDIRVLQAASWWTPERLGIAFGVASTVLLLTLGWVGLLRRQVDRRTAQLSHEMRERQNAKVQFEAVLQERVRLAADLHDSLEQSLTGAALQLRAMELALAEEPSAAPQNLALVRQILDNSRDEVRRSVWGLRARALDNFSLDDALKEMARQIPANSGARIEVHTEGEPHPVPDLIANHLLRVGQEAMGNALKHGRARKIDITLRYEQGRVELTVVDDGTGFEASTCPGPAEGHFGLQGMRERAKRVGGIFQLESNPGRGTRIITAVTTASKQ